MGWHRSLCNDWFPSKWNGWFFWTSKSWLNFWQRAVPFLDHSSLSYSQNIHLLFLPDLYEFEGSLYGLIFCTTKHEKWRKQQVGADLKTKARFKSISVWKTQVNRVVYFIFMCTERVAEFWWFLLTLYKVILQYLGLKDTIRPRKMQAKPRKIMWDLFVGMCLICVSKLSYLKQAGISKSWCIKVPFPVTKNVHLLSLGIGSFIRQFG